jgi:hypothetical protein
MWYSPPRRIWKPLVSFFVFLDWDSKNSSLLDRYSFTVASTRRRRHPPRPEAATAVRPRQPPPPLDSQCKWTAAPRGRCHNLIDHRRLTPVDAATACGPLPPSRPPLSPVDRRSQRPPLPPGHAQRRPPLLPTLDHRR